MAFIFGILGGFVGFLILFVIDSYLKIKDIDNETFTKPKLRDYDKEQKGN
jgi:hypothetical protein